MEEMQLLNTVLDFCPPGSSFSIISSFFLGLVSLSDSLKSFILAIKELAASELYFVSLERASDYYLYFFSISEQEYMPLVVFTFFLNYLISTFTQLSPSSYLSLSTSMENCSSLSTTARGSFLQIRSCGLWLRFRLVFISNLLPTLVNWDWNISDSIQVFQEIGCRLKISLFFNFCPFSSFSMMVSNFSLNFNNVSIQFSCWRPVSWSSTISLQHFSASSFRQAFYFSNWSMPIIIY